MTSPAAHSQTSLFGVELAEVWAALTRPWRNLHRSAALGWLAPQVEVRLIQADGQESAWAGGRRVSGAVAANIPFVAVEVPEERYLRRTLSLPPMDSADLDNAVALDVQSASPFGLQDLVWGYKVAPVAGQRVVDVVFASRRQIGQYLESLGSRLPEGADPEVWVCVDGGDPIILGGYGENRRAGYVASRWKVGVALMLLAAVLLTAVAVTPTAQLRLRAIQALQANEEVVRRAQPLLKKREQMVQASADLALLNSIMAQRVDAAYFMDYLTRIIPNDTSLLSLNIQGGKAVLVGQTTNAAALMQRLSSEPGLRDVRAPSAAIRPMGSPKETFTVEFTLDAHPAASPAPRSAMTSSAPAAAPPPAGTLAPVAGGSPIAAPAAAAPSIAAPAPTPALGAAPPQAAAPSAPGVAASPFAIGGTATPRSPVSAPAPAPKATP
jgi:general secretion pathway protein L